MNNSARNDLDETSQAWEDLLTLCEQTMEVCHGHTSEDDPHYSFGYVITRCRKPPTHVIRWSDRVAYTCGEHVDCIKGYAARDNSGDRTDAPYIDSFSNGDIVLRYWDKLVERAKRL